MHICVDQEAAREKNDGPSVTQNIMARPPVDKSTYRRRQGLTLTQAYPGEVQPIDSRPLRQYGGHGSRARPQFYLGNPQDDERDVISLSGAVSKRAHSFQQGQADCPTPVSALARFQGLLPPGFAGPSAAGLEDRRVVATKA